MSGWGRLFLDRAKYHDDLRLWNRAIKQRWKIDESFRDIAVERLRKIIEECDDDEIALKAIAQVRQLEAQNQKDEHKVLDVRVQIRHDQLPGIAADLGIEVSAIEDAAREADSGVGDTATESD